MECQKPLLPLLARCPGIDQLDRSKVTRCPTFATHAPLVSLPRILQTSLDDVPAAVPYLFAAAVRWWSFGARSSAICRATGSESIGKGVPGAAPGASATFPCDSSPTLAEIPGVRLISLQKGAAREELAQARDYFPVVDLGDEVDQAHGAFMDTAAIMMNLDLVITSDTAVPHLAGALGVPVWVALPRVPTGDWMLDRTDSPWYPTMRLFRQRKRGNWQAVLEEIRGALCERLASL